MPYKKAHLAKSSSSSILNYFPSSAASDAIIRSQNQNNNASRSSRASQKRKGYHLQSHIKPDKKLCNIVNTEPIVITSSDGSDSETPCNREKNIELENVKHSKDTSYRGEKGGETVPVITAGSVPDDQDEAYRSLESVSELPSVDGNDPSDIFELEDDTPDDGKIAFYHLNFCHVLDTVLEVPDDQALFQGSEDMEWIEKFKSMPLPAQKLYVRLYHRKAAWLRKEQINYPNIATDIHKVLEYLRLSGFLLSFTKDTTSELDLNQVLRLLPAQSLRDIAKSFRISVAGLHKGKIREEICKMCRQQKSLITGFLSKKSTSNMLGLRANVLKKACISLGPCYKVATAPRKAFNRVLLVFDVTRGIDDELDCTLTGSKNAMGQGRHLQLSAILMAGMGKVRYPQFELNRQTSIFKRRADLLQYETAFQFQMDVMACVESGRWEDAAAICEDANSVNRDMITNDSDATRHAENLPEFLRPFTASWVYTRLRSLQVEILQRLKKYHKAAGILRELLDQRVYCRSRRGHWWERLALNTDQHLKDQVQSMNIIHESLEDCDVRVGHKLALAERANKILSSKSVKRLPQLTTMYKEKLKPIIERLEIQHAPVVEITGCLLPTELQSGKSRFVAEVPGDDPESSSTLLCSVEELALSHYKSAGYPCGIHGEGGTFSTLLFLFLWDIVFMDGIPDVFRTSYQVCDSIVRFQANVFKAACPQAHPLDLHTDGFYLRRQESIEKRLSEIFDITEEDFDGEDKDFGDELKATVIDIFTSTWDMEYGKSCSGMDWERFSSIEEALGLVKCIGGKVLSGIFRRLCKDLRHTRSGLPDLVVWNTTSKTYKLVEVKGPGDRLSTNQKLWIDELLALGSNIEVCKVIGVGGKRIS